MDSTNKKPEEMPMLSEAEMKAIGEISIGPAKHEIFLNKHYKKLIWGTIGLAVAGASLIAWFSYRNSVREAAAAELIDAMNAQQVLSDDISALQFKGEELRSIAENSRYGSTPSAATARLLEALRLVAAGQESAGFAVLEGMAADSSNPVLAARAAAELASRYMLRKDDAKAAEYWKRVLDLAPSPYSALACMSLGDIERAAGNPDAADAYYNRAVNDYVSSGLVQAPSLDISVAFRKLILGTTMPMLVSPPAEPAPSAPSPSVPAPSSPSESVQPAGGGVLDTTLGGGSDTTLDTTL